MWHIVGCFWHIYFLCSGGMNHHSSHHWIKGDLPVCLVGIFLFVFQLFHTLEAYFLSFPLCSSQLVLLQSTALALEKAG